jgi:hypothetical protein
MPIDLQGIRRDAAGRARRRSRRVVHFSRDCPSEWRPRSVVNPNTGEPFTDDSAWNFLADLLDTGAELSPVTLARPYGNNDRGYVVMTALDIKELYIKFQLGSCDIIGRSFHYSTQSRGTPTPSSLPGPLPPPLGESQ